MLFDVRASGARFDEYRDPAQTFDPARLGFSQTAVQMMNGYQYLPLFTFGSFSTTNANSTIASLGSQRADWGEGFERPMDTFAVQPTVTAIRGGHTARAGYEFRYQRWKIISSGYPGGRFQFNGFYTRASNSAGLNDPGQVWAQFLLGLPTTATGAVAAPGTQSSQFELASEGRFSQGYHALFVQDDWRVGPKLTINAGLRMEINSGMKEAQDRNLAGFDFTTPNPIEGAARAAYAANPIPEIPVSAFRVTGGLLFADGPANETVTKFLPRAAASYLLGERTVLRGGIGLFSYDYFFENINQAGFAQATPVIVSTDTGLTFTGANLTNPVPSGQLIQPVGSALGLQSQLGQNLGTLYQREREAAYYTRWEGSIQRDFGGGWVGAFTYMGSRGSKLPTVQSVNNLPMAYLSTSRTRDVAQEAYLSQTVTNPFAGLLPGSTLNNATISRGNLLRPYPHFGTFASETYEGTRSVSRRHGPAAEAFPQRQLHHDAVHALVAAGPAELPEPGRWPARRSDFAQRPAEPVLDRHGLPAAVRAQRAVGPRVGRSAGGDSRGLAVEQHLPVSERRTAHLGKRLLRLRLRRSAGARSPSSASRSPPAWPGSTRPPGTRRASTSTTRPSRPTAWTTRRCSARTRGFSSGTTSATSPRRSGTSGPTTCTCSTSACRRASSCPGGCGCSSAWRRSTPSTTRCCGTRTWIPATPASG